jgi:cyclopropane-fatty-acyl-phospholipid synthase
MQTLHVEDLTPHYVPTLMRWREEFIANAQELERIGYDTRFRRLWTLYLAYCEAGFAERRICEVQVVLGKPHYRRSLPPAVSLESSASNSLQAAARD